MADLVAVEVHHVDVVGARALSGRGHRAALAGVRPVEDGIRGNALAFGVDSERLQLVAAVGKHSHHPLHPLRIVRQCPDLREWLGLCRKCGVGMTIGAARLPPLTRVECIEERPRRRRDRRGLRCCHRYSSRPPGTRSTLHLQAAFSHGAASA